MPILSVNINFSSVTNPASSDEDLDSSTTTLATTEATLTSALHNFDSHNVMKQLLHYNSNATANTNDDTITATTLFTPLLANSSHDVFPHQQHHQHYTNDTTQLNSQHLFDFGPSRDSLHIVIPVTIIYSLIFISGVIGNISTCIVIKKNRSMHTATNYYLFSLAISDFLLLLSGVPQEMYFIWSKYPYVFGEYFCIGRGVLAETSANATVLTITAFTVERYVAICHPFLGQAMSKLSRAIRIIVLIWLVSVLTAIPQAAQFGIITLHGIEKCVVVRDIIQHSFQLSTFIFFFAPMSIILVLYLLIGLRLYRSNLIGGGVSAGAGAIGGSVLDASDELNTSAARGSSNSNSNNGGVGRLVFGSTNFVRSSGRKSSARLGMKATQSDTMLYRYAGGNQLSAVRGRMNQYGTRRVLKMLVAVVICFFLCWAPFHAQRLIAVYGTNVIGGGGGGGGGGGSSGGNVDEIANKNNAHNMSISNEAHNTTNNIIINNNNNNMNSTNINDNDAANDKYHQEIIYTVMTYVSGVLYYLSTCINPLLYNMMSNKFRQAFKSILFRKKSMTGSINSRRAQQSQRLRRNPTLTSSAQRESSESEPQSKHSMLQAVLNERKVTNQMLT